MTTPITIDNLKILDPLMPSEPRHECTYGYVWGYEIARGLGVVDDNVGILINRGVSKPDYRIVFGREFDQSFLDRYQELSAQNGRAAQIHALLNPPHIADKTNKRQQAILHLEKIRIDPYVFCGKKCKSNRNKAALRKNLQELKFEIYNPIIHYDAAIELIDIWKDWIKKIGDSSKTFRLATSRDYILARDWGYTEGCFGLIGFREGLPASLFLAERIINNSKQAALLVEKCLNYKNLPGGYNETSYATLVMFAQTFPEIEELNWGSVHGGGKGLAIHKTRMMDRIEVTYDVTLPFSPVESKFQELDLF